MLKYRKWFVAQRQQARGRDEILLEKLNDTLKRALIGIDKITAAGRINPWINVVTLSHNKAHVPHNSPTPKRISRVGVLPLAANPLHWGHLLLALIAVSKLKLDTVVFLVQGKITYKHVENLHDVPAKDRHEMVKDVVDDFYPLLRYTDVSLRGAQLGEGAVHDLRRLNLNRRVEFVCFWGLETKGRVKRIMRQLTEAAANQADLGPGRNYNLEVVFVELRPSRTLLDIRMLRRIKEATGVRFKCRLLRTPNRSLEGFTSTLYRSNLDSRLVPPKVHRYVVTHKLYGSPNRATTQHPFPET